MKRTMLAAPLLVLGLIAGCAQGAAAPKPAASASSPAPVWCSSAKSLAAQIAATGPPSTQQLVTWSNEAGNISDEITSADGAAGHRTLVAGYAITADDLGVQAGRVSLAQLHADARKLAAC